MGISDWLVRKKLVKLAAAEGELFAFPVPGMGLMCPYCMKVVRYTPDMGPAKECMIDHLMHDCDTFEDTEDELPPLSNLQKRAHFLFMKQNVTKNPAWRVLDKAGTWYCPYCAKPTEVRYSGKKEDMDKLVNDISKHLNTCFEYGEDPDNYKSVEHMKKIVNQIIKEKSLVAQITKKVEAKDDLFMQTNNSARWICPYCVNVVEQVSMATELLLQCTAPTQMAQHIMARCPVATKGGKIKSLTEVTKAVESIRAETGKKKKDADTSGGGQDAEYMEILKGEIMAIRNDMKVNEELEQSLEKARKVVLNMLPKSVPQVEGYEFATYFESCTHVGGDFYDFIDLGEDRWAIAVGDVSGHGLDATLVMSMGKKALGMRAKQFNDPKEVLVHTNSDIFADLEKSTFITCFYGIFDPKSHSINLARAGHNFTLVYRAATGKVDTIKSPGMSLGMNGGIIFEKALQTVSVELEKGDAFVQYTDGLTEAMNKAKLEYGMERYIDIIEQFGKYDAEYMLDKVISDVKKYMGDYPAQDDISMTVVRRKDA